MVALYTLKIKSILDKLKLRYTMSKDMEDKVVVNIGYSKYVMSPEDGITLLKAFCRAEVYEEKWHSDRKENSLHVYPLSDASKFSMHVLNKEVYNVAKLAGKPE